MKVQTGVLLSSPWIQICCEFEHPRGTLQEYYKWIWKEERKERKDAERERTQVSWTVFFPWGWKLEQIFLHLETDTVILQWPSPVLFFFLSGWHLRWRWIRILGSWSSNKGVISLWHALFSISKLMCSGSNKILEDSSYHSFWNAAKRKTKIQWISRNIIATSASGTLSLETQPLTSVLCRHNPLQTPAAYTQNSSWGQNPTPRVGTGAQCD